MGPPCWAKSLLEEEEIWWEGKEKKNACDIALVQWSTTTKIEINDALFYNAF